MYKLNEEEPIRILMSFSISGGEGTKKRTV
jgi:hypothetical protein